MKKYTKPEVSVVQFGMTEAITSDFDGVNNDDDIVVGDGFSANVEWWE